MKDGIGNRCQNSDHSQLTHSFDTQWINNLVIFFDEDRFYIGNIGIDRNVIMLEICIHYPNHGEELEELLKQLKNETVKETEITERFNDLRESLKTI
jgi:hypothetical protein